MLLTGHSLIGLNNTVEKHSRMRHPTIRLLRSDFVAIRTDEVGAVHAIETATPSEAMDVRVVMCPQQVREVDQDAAFGTPLLASLYAKESFRDCRFPIFKAELLIRTERQEGPCNGGFT